MESLRCGQLSRICGSILGHQDVFRRLHLRSLNSPRLRSFLKVQLASPASFPFSNGPSWASKVVTDSGQTQLSEEFPNPKCIVQSVINEAFLLNPSHELKPDLSIEQVFERSTGKNLWKANLSVMWPVKFAVESVAGKKTEAEKLTYALACKKFKEFGILSAENLPVLPKSQWTADNQEVSHSKQKLNNIYQTIWPKFGTRDAIPIFNSSAVKGLFGNDFWKSELRLKYPEEISFEGFAHRIPVAEGIASAKALQWLCKKGIIDENMKPVLHSKEEEMEMLDNQRAPYPISIPCNLQLKMKETLEHFKEFQNHFNEVNNSSIEGCFQSTKVSVLCDDFSEFGNENDSGLDFAEVVDHRAKYQCDIITEKPLQEFCPEELGSRSQVMYDRLIEWETSNDTRTLKILKDQTELPIFKSKEEILRCISENQVVVLSGETGCGKTTQVPQYILNSYIKEMRGSDCNIIVTQPRRISAISIAARVASERGEEVGETIGHQVRFDKNLPAEKGAVLFCSTGILLRKLCLNPSLENVSHIIVDEVHERNVQIDFLLILLKNILRTNKNIKVMLMSATFNYEIFSQYFDQCPILNIPGFVYPVEQLFLDGANNLTEYQNNDFANPRMNLKLVADTVKLIHGSRPPGAILCFLPGWNEIKAVANTLREELEGFGTNYVIYPAHSRLSHEKQKLIFSSPSDGVRKIILATNIAETSITVSDVVYVVDSGLQKETSFYADKGTAALGIQWISKANVQQRKGRAGRVQPGISYHLYPKKIFEAMEDYPTPEMLRMPLEKVILDCKLYCPDIKAEDFLSLALQPPARESIQHGVKELQMLEILDENENLTVLGKTIINFTSHPRLSKALVLGAFLRCLDPILTVSAFLTLSRDPFINSLEDNEGIRMMKKEYDQGSYSDHLAMCKIYNLWPGSRGEEEEVIGDFAAKHKLDEDSLIFIKRLKDLFAEHLVEAGLIDDRYTFTNPEATCNENSSDVNIVLSALCSAFYPNIIKLMQGEKKRGRLKKGTIICSTMRGLKACYAKESVAYRQRCFSSPWFIYFSALKSEARNSLLTQEVSLVPGLSLLLFAGCDLSHRSRQTASKAEDREFDVAVLQIDNFSNLSFRCSVSEEEELLMDWRKCFRQLLHAQLAIPEKNSVWTAAFHEKYIPVLKKVLSTGQAPFISGKKFYLCDGELVWKYID